MKRRIRRRLEIAIPLVGMGIIFGSTLFGPDSLQLQVLLVLFGVLILEAGVWGVTNGLMPDERQYLQLREEGDHFLGLIRILNEAAVARDKGDESEARFREIRAQMHTSVERMAEFAGKGAPEELEAVVIEAAEAVLVEAEAVLVEVETEAEETAVEEIAAETTDRELDPARPNA